MLRRARVALRKVVFWGRGNYQKDTQYNLPCEFVLGCSTVVQPEYVFYRTTVVVHLHRSIRLKTVRDFSLRLQYRLYRRTCRRVCTIRNVLLRTIVPRRTAISSDDGVTTRFASFSLRFHYFRALRCQKILLLFFDRAHHNRNRNC
jgi:hypothetical protein